MSRTFARMRELDEVTREQFEEWETALRDALLHVQDDLAGRDFPVIVVLDGDDFTGCEHAFELLHAWFDARYLRAEAFEQVDGASTDSVWMQRWWSLLPPRGTIGLWLRSWSMSTVTQRVLDRIDDAQLDARIRDIVATEQMLAADGAVFVKLWVRVPKKTLARRLEQAREGDEWRVQCEDELALDSWKQFQDVAERVVDATDQPHAPWIVVDGRHGRSRSVAIARTIAEVVRARLDEERKEPAEPPPDRLAASPTTMLDRVEQLEPMDDGDYERVLLRWQAKLSRLHREAFARGIAAVLVFEGQDAAGKGGAIRRMTRALDAPKYRIFPISAPDDRERSRHWLWRFWIRLPRLGRVSVFDRSWYGRVLVERVEGFAKRAEWRRAYGEIEAFEQQITAQGAVLVKVWLHVSPEEQARRFDERSQVSFKRYKIGPDDWRNRARAFDYEAAAVEMFESTSGAAPWHVVPADDKNRARIEVIKRVCAAYEERLRSARDV
ncbi:MAG: hypothetical protein U1F36_20760 [Planctomycetota bacterium]